MKNIDYYLLIHKSLSGEISEQEDKVLEEWLALRPDNRVLFEEIKLVWESSGNAHSETVIPYDPKEELLLIQERIRKEIPENEKNTPVPHRRFVPLQIAAVILLLIISNLTTWYLIQSKESSAPEIKNGENFSELLLPDGSKVSLNKNTTFSFKETKNKREVHLQGEAYFDVNKDQERPFYIHLPRASVKVVGTSFNINTNAGEDRTAMIVTSGTVEFFNQSESITIYPGEKAVLSGINSQIKKQVNSDPNFDSWKTGIFNFNNTQMSSVLTLLENHYNVAFRVHNQSILSCRFTGTFDNDRLEKILQVLSYGLHFEYSFNNDHYLLSGKGCKKSK